MRSFLSEVMPRISPERRHCLKKSSSRYGTLILIMTTCIFENFIRGAVYTHIHHEYDTFTVAVMYLGVYLVLGQWTVTGYFVCCFFIEAMTMYEDTLLDNILSQVGTPKVGEEILAVVRVRVHRATVLKKSVMPLFSIIPCITVSYLFIALAGLLIKMNMGFSDYYALVEFLTLMIILSSLMWLTHVSDSGNEMVLKKVQQIETMILGSSKQRIRVDFEAVIVAIRELSCTRHESCALFTVNRRFSVTFLSSLFAFTALLIQIFTGIGENAAQMN